MTHLISSLLLVIAASHLQVDSQLCNTPDWLHFEDSQYLIINYPPGPGRSHSDAIRFCRSQGGDLVIITSSEQNAFIVTYTRKQQVGWNYWIGLHDNNDDGAFTWINNTQSGFSNWLSGPLPGERCVRMRSTLSDLDQGKWQASECFVERVHICQRPWDLRCSWHLYGQSFYRIYGEGTNFDDARTECQNGGGDLATIRSDELNSFLGALITTTPLMNQCYWFGLRDVGRNDTFVWTDGTRISDAESNWSTGQPIHPSKDCACLLSDGDASWTSNDCSISQPYICERPRVLLGKWEEFNSVLYYMPPHSTNYFQARLRCKQLGGLLAQLKTSDLSAFVGNFGQDFWFGLDDLGDKSDFRWADGTLLNDTGFSDWDTDEPNNEQGYEYCVISTSDGWRDVYCSDNHRFVCEISQAPPLHLQAVTSASLGSMESSPQYTCVLSPSDRKPENQIFTERLVRQSWTEEGYTLHVPGEASLTSGEQLTRMLPTNDQSVGVYKCSSTDTSTGTSTSVAVTILAKDRQFEPADGRLTRTVYPGESVTLSVIKKASYIADDDQIRWRTFSNLAEGSLSPMGDGSLMFAIDSATDKDADIYGTYQEGVLESLQYSLIRVIVSACPTGRWGVPFCDRLCDNCYNGGVCHPQSGTCICAPGFSGKNCLRACGENQFGWDCELSCGPGEVVEECSGSRVCLPDPYGCSCLSGYTGINCNEDCPAERFGVDCLQECHCLGGASCDSFTGRCEGNCENGWSGEGCQVPSVCPEGYFGLDCTDHCNCPGNSFCDRESGYCTQSEGVCEIGYIADSAAFPESCSTFTGCFDSCTETCHCADGPDDCDQQTGICSSDSCHPRWLGENCQRDRFQVSREKTNPGVASFSCTIDFGTTTVIQPDYVKAATIDFSLENWHLAEGNTSIETVNFTFLLTNVTDDPEIYCFIGNPQDNSGFAYVRLPSSEYFVLPVLSTEPQEFDIGHHHVGLRWRPWDQDSDIGDGPIVAYNIYVFNANNTLVNMVKVTTTKPCPACTSDMLEYNVVGLEPGTSYIFRISATRDGINGEGEKGPPLSVITMDMESTSTTCPLSTSECHNSSLPSWVLFAIAMLGNIILAGLLARTCLKARQSNKEPSIGHSKAVDTDPEYENPAFDGSIKNGTNQYQDLQEPIREGTYEELDRAKESDYVNQI